MRTKPAGLDFIVVAAVIAVAVLLMLIPLLMPKGATLTVSARRGNETVILYELDLQSEQSFEIENNGIKLKITVSNGMAFVEHSTCADGVCSKSGSISRAGQSIICAPAGIVISVRGGSVKDDILAQ